MLSLHFPLNFMGHKGPSFWREQPYIMYTILKAFLTVDFFTPWSIYTTDWAERKISENVKIGVCIVEFDFEIYFYLF